MTTESKKLQTLPSTGEGVSCPSCLASPSVTFNGFDCGIICDASDDEAVTGYSCGTIRALVHDARIAHSLMDPTRKTAETPLEHEQREVIAHLARCIRRVLDESGLAFVEAGGDDALAAAAPFLED